MAGPPAGTGYWKGLKGLWTKDFTYRPDANDAGYGFYIWTNKADLDEYLKGQVWGMMTQIPHIVDIQEPRMAKIMVGNEQC